MNDNTCSICNEDCIECKYNNITYSANSTVVNLGFNTIDIKSDGTHQIEMMTLLNILKLTAPSMTDLNLRNLDLNNYKPVLSSDKIVLYDTGTKQKVLDEKNTEIEFPELPNFPNLKTLNLSGAKISEELLILLLNNAPNIQIINLIGSDMSGYGSFTRLGSQSKLSLKPLNNIKNLLLDYTNINSSTLGSLLNNTPNIEWLSLMNNVKSTYDSGQFIPIDTNKNSKIFNNLSFLNVSNISESTNGVSNSISFNNLVKLLNIAPNLVTLQASSNNFLLDTSAQSLNPLIKLETSILNDTNISADLLNSILLKTPNLTELFINDNNNLDSKYLETIAPNVLKLTGLHLYNNKNVDNKCNTTTNNFNEKNILMSTPDVDGLLTSLNENILKKSLTIQNLNLPYSDSYYYGDFAHKKYNKVIINTIQQKYEKDEDGDIGPCYLVDIVDNITEYINSLYSIPPSNQISHTTQIIIIIVISLILMALGFFGFKFVINNF